MAGMGMGLPPAAGMDLTTHRFLGQRCANQQELGCGSPSLSWMVTCTGLLLSWTKTENQAAAQGLTSMSSRRGAHLSIAQSGH